MVRFGLKPQMQENSRTNSAKSHRGTFCLREMESTHDETFADSEISEYKEQG